MVGVFIAVNLIFFQVDQTEFAVLTQFGKPVRAITEPGLYRKLPDPVQSVQRYDNRMMVYLPNQAEFLTRDKKNIVTESYPVWRIEDPVSFMKTVRDMAGARDRLSDILSSELGVAFGQYDLSSLITTDEKGMKLPEMMERVIRVSNEKVKAYGMTVADVRIKVLNFPEKTNSVCFSACGLNASALPANIDPKAPKKLPKFVPKRIRKSRCCCPRPRKKPR